MGLVGPITFMQARLGHHDGPRGVSFAHCSRDGNDGVLGHIHGPHGDEYHLRPAFGEMEILRGVVSDLANSPCIEKAQDRRVRRKIEHARGRCTGFKAVADLRFTAVRDGTHDRGLAALYFPDHPDDGRKSRGFSHYDRRWIGGCGNGIDVGDDIPGHG